MNFKIIDLVYTKKSGSLENVVDAVNYEFTVSESIDGALISEYHVNSIIMPAAKSAGYVAYSSLTESTVKGWVEVQHISESSANGVMTSSLWGSYTSSIETDLNYALSASASPPTAIGTPW
jgi:hypothetical protein